MNRTCTFPLGVRILLALLLLVGNPALLIAQTYPTWVPGSEPTLSSCVRRIELKYKTEATIPSSYVYSLSYYQYDIYSFFEKNNLAGLKPVFVRWTVQNLDGTTPAALNTWTIQSTSGSGYVRTSLGLHWTSSSDFPTGAVPHPLNIRITPPSGVSLKDYKVVCFITDSDLSGLPANTEPVYLRLKYEFTLRQLDDDFEHNYRPGAGIYTSDQIEEVRVGNTTLAYQKTETVNYDLYVVPGQTVNLMLPIAGLTYNESSVTGNADGPEPQGYYRWYNYHTDLKDPNTARYQGSGLYDQPYGWVRHNPSNAGQDYSVLKYNSPADLSNEGVVIACDVSDYRDHGLTVNNEFYREPTLSIRYLFTIRPASVMADSIKKCNSEGTYYEEYGLTTLNCRDASTNFALRVAQRAPFDYYMYDSANNMVKGNAVFWRVTRKDGTVIANNIASNSQGRFYVFNKSNYSTIAYDEEFYVIAYMRGSDYSTTCDIARYRCIFRADRAVLQERALPDYRKSSYLNDHFVLAAEDNFDRLGEKGSYDFSAPTIDNNLVKVPYNVDNSSYGFIYPTLYHYKTFSKKYSPVHGEYGYYKSANLAGVSTSTQSYQWWGSGTIYDRSYHESEGARYGYFLYTDASEESRPFEGVVFDAALCPDRSTVILTAWIADYTSGSEKPQVMFRIYGLRKDDHGNVIGKDLLHNVLTGSINYNGYNWGQVYADIMLQSTEIYSSYKVTIDNFCTNTSGADYVVDDIRIYIKNAKVDVTQLSVPCKSDEVQMRMLGDYEGVIEYLAIANDETKELRYQLVDSMGNVVFAKYNGASDLVEYGEKTISATFPTGVDSNYLTVDGTKYFVFESDLLVTLDPNMNYYLSVADYDGTSLYWGNKKDPCSIFSEVVWLERPHIEITDLYGNTVFDIDISCGENNVVMDKLKATLVVPDGEGGHYKFDDLKFDWFKGDIVPDLLGEALRAMRREYPITSSIGASITSDNVSSLATTQYFTESDRTLISTYKEHIVFGANELNNYALLVGKTIFHLFNTISSIRINVGTPQEKDMDICDELMIVELNVVVVGRPILDLGFDEVDYSLAGYGSSTLRLGLKQLAEMQDYDYRLYLPIKDYTNGGDREADRVVGLDLVPGNVYLNLVSTDDPTYSDAETIMKMETYLYHIAQITFLEALVRGLNRKCPEW